MSMTDEHTLRCLLMWFRTGRDWTIRQMDDLMHGAHGDHACTSTPHMSPCLRCVAEGVKRQASVMARHHREREASQ